MPFTPFIGISVLIHLLVIIRHRIFNRGAALRSLIVPQATKLVQFGITSIVVFVFAGILFSASSLVRASIYDKNSSINLVEEYFKNASTVVYNSKDSLSISNKPFLSSTAFASNELPMKPAPIACINTKTSVTHSSGSLVNYLVSKKQNYSFAYRNSLAVSNGIKNYVGSSQQNILLLDRMVGLASCQS